MRRTFGQPTYQSRPKLCNVFGYTVSTLHPRINDEGTYQGEQFDASINLHHLIDPGVWGSEKMRKPEGEELI